MNQINNFYDEESSNYNILGDFCSRISPSMSPEFQTLQLSEENEKINEEIKAKNFENHFNQVFNKSNIALSTISKESPPYITKRKIFKQIKPIRKEKIIINYEEKNEKFFPFSPGIGLEKCLKDIGYLAVNVTPLEIKLFSLNKENMKKTKFQIMDFSRVQKGKIKKEKKQRKYKPDDLRKKIKIRFHKSLKNVININLKGVGSKKLFDFFPQYFIRNVNIKLNNIAFNYTFEELITRDIAVEILKQKKTYTDLEKFNRNLDVLDYLNNNPKICNDSLFDKIRNMKYIDILNAYFISKEFEDSIFDLNKKGENIEYIEEYINKSLSYVYFFQNTSSKQNTKNSEYDNDTNDPIFGNIFDNEDDYVLNYL